jgi:hypothetical protein
LVGDTVNDGERSSWNGQRAEYSLALALQRHARADQLDDEFAQSLRIDWSSAWCFS